MTVDIATLGIKVDSSDTTKAATELDKLKKSGDIAGASIKTLEKESKLLGIGMSALGGVISGLSFAAFATSLINTNRQMEALRAQLSAVSKSGAEAQSTFETITKFAKDTPFEIDGLTKTFIVLKNMGIEPTIKVMDALTNQAAKLGGSQETLTSIAMQLGQAYSKGSLQMEDMRVLMERGVPVMDILAQVTGKQTSELADMSAKGLITRDVIDQLIVKMGELASGSNARAMDTLNGKISMLSDSWHTFEDTLLNDKSEGILKSIVSAMSSALDSLTLHFQTGLDAEIKRAEQKVKDYKDSFGLTHLKMMAKGDNLTDLQGNVDYLKQQKQLEDWGKEQVKIHNDSAKAIDETNKWISESESIAAKETIKHSTVRAVAHKSVASAAKSAAQMEAEALESNFQRMKDDLARELALKGDSSRLAALEYDTEAGALRKFTEAQKLYLLQTTSAIENAAIEKRISEDKKTEMDQLIDKYNQLTLSARDYYKLTLTNKGIAPDQQGEFLAKFDKTEAFIKQSKEIDDATKSVSEYITNLDKATESMQGLGDVSSAVFDGALGGINLLIGALKNSIKLTDDHTKRLKENSRQQVENSKILDPVLRNLQERALYEDRINLDNQATQIQLSNIRQIVSATAQMFDEQSAGYKTLAGLANGIGGFEANMSLQQASKGMTGIAATATSMAGYASIAVGMVEAFRSIGSIFFGGTSVGKKPTIAGTGTVLGDTTAVSESIGKVTETLKNIHADEYKELLGINSGIKTLTESITGSINNLFAGGGLADVKVSGLGEKKNYIFDFFNLFGSTSKKVVGGGVRIMAAKIDDLLQGVMIEAMQYTTIEKTKTNFFGGKKISYSTKLTALDKDFTDSLTDIFVNAANVIGQLSEQLGSGLGDKVKNYIIPAMNVELKGLNSEESVKALSGAISAALDDMATSVFGDIIGQYQQLGEGMLETATRIVAQMAVVKDALATSGLSMGDNAIYISNALAQAAGGLEEFQQQFDTFYDKFYTDAEKQTRLAAKLGSQLSEIFTPETIQTLGTARSEYRKVIEALDMSNELDRERYSLLLSLAGAADQYYTALETGAAQAQAAAEQARQAQEQLNQSYIAGLESVLNAQEQAYQDRLAATKQGVSDAFSALQRAVGAEKESVTSAYNSAVKNTQNIIDKISDSVQRLTSLSSALKSSINALNMPGNELSNRKAAQSVISSSLRTVKAGGLPNDEALQKALSTIAEPSQNLFSNFTDYQRDFYKTAIDIDTMSKLIDQQLTKEKTALDIAKEQLENQKDNFDKQIAALDQIVENGQDMIDSLNGVSKSIGSVAGAMGALQSAIGAQKAVGGGGGAAGVSNLVSAAQGYSDPAQGTIASLYAGILGRAPDKGGLDYWTNTLKSGQTVAAIADSFKASSEYQAIKAIRGYATGGKHPGGWRLVGEQGPELEYTPPSQIYNNAQTGKMLSFDELIAEVKSLRSDIRAGQESIAKNTQDTAKQLKKWDGDGMPATTTA